MARTRSKGIASPRAPTPTKSKKGGASNSPAASPSIKKSKAISKNKSAGKSKMKELQSKEVPSKEVKSKGLQSEESQASIVSKNVADKAISELGKYLDRETAKEESNKTLLFDNDDETRNLFLQITTKKFYSSKPNFKPKMIKLTNSYLNPESKSLKTCLIIRDQLITDNEQLETIENANLPTLQQIIPLNALKTEYKHYEKRRQLYSEYDLFLVDDALLNSMPTLLGKIFYGNGNKKIPLPIRVTSTSNNKEFSITTIGNQLSKCLTSTFFLPPVGVNISIKIGTITEDFQQNQLVENLQDVLNHFDKDTLRSVMIKTDHSPALPLYYTEKLYSDEDVLSDANAMPSKKSDDNNEVKLSAFEKGLLELGDADEVAKIIGKKLKKKQEQEQQQKQHKVTKPKTKVKSISK